MRGEQTLSVVLVVMLVALYALVLISPNAAAASTSWTTDTDFNAVGSEFTATEVVGTGIPASVHLLKDFVDWANLNPSGPPAARESAGFAFATSSNLAFLFGGYDGTDLGDTWQYNYATNTWTQLNLNPRPAGREAPGFSYDSVEDVIVLFGGFNTSDPDIYLTDTWEFDVPTKMWSQITPATAPGRVLDSPLVYDSAASRHILVGSNATTATVETWAYDAANDAWAFQTQGTPATRTSYALAYHTQRARTVLFGGFEPLPFPGTPKGDTWEYRYSTNSWQMTVPDGGGPSARSYAAMTYRPASRSVLLFGGGSPPNGDTWRYSETAVWESVGTLTSPPARNHAGLSYHVAEDVALLFGGRGAGGVPLDDTWKMGAAYRAGGWYISGVFNSGGANVQWGLLWWNRTVQPALTFLRLQIATSTIPNPALWDFLGPDGTRFTYYSAAGSQIHSTHNNEQYLRFRADFGSTDPQSTPVLEDVTIGYNVPPAPPYISTTDPATPTFDVPLNKVIRVVFSEPMNSDSVTWTFIEGPPVGFNKVWSSGDTILDLTHSIMFEENQRYRIRIDGTDLDGNVLVAGPVPNPMIFVTVKYNPYIVSTNPFVDQMDVLLTAPILVRFNESMNTSTLQHTIVPLVGLSASWNSPTNDTVTLSHTTAFDQCTEFTVEIVQANDTAGLPLRPGPAPNPWTFTSLCINPYLTSTSPYDLQGQVSVNALVYVNFSKSMSQANTTLTLSPDVAGKSFQWFNADRTLRMSHSAFAGCTPYTVTVTGTDPAGNVLIGGPSNAAPNPFKFMTVCANPYIVITRPEDGDTNVALDRVIIIAFSETMNEPSVQYEITPAVFVVDETWRFSLELDITHSGFQECTEYTVRVTAARSAMGFTLVPGIAPNPWMFSTVCESPYVTATDPADGDTLVPLAQPIVVDFSEPMDNTTVVVTPTPGIILDRTWSNNNMRLTLTHVADFQDCTEYSIFVDGIGADGRSLIIPGPSVPNPWFFTTLCVTLNPYITRTDPAHNEQNVPVTRPVVVEFSEPMDQGAFQAMFSPAVTGVSPSWMGGDTIVTLNHDPFATCTLYTVTVFAKDLQGNDLINVTGSKPNPWSFRTACPALPAPGGLQVIRLFPNDVLLTWRAVPGAASYLVFSSPNRFAPWPWPVRQEVPTTSFLAGGDLLEPTPRYYIVRAKDSGGAQGLNSTMGAKAPLAFASPAGRPGTYWISLPYRTMYRRASDISTELTATRIDVVGKWDPARQTSVLWYQFRGQWRGTNFPINPGDGLWVGVRSPFTWVVNGTDGAVPLTFTLNGAPLGNVNWISLPFTSTYSRASHLVLDIEGSLGPGANTRIVEVAKWDGASQSLVRYFWTTTGWSGTDFTIASGEGVYFRIVSTFTWTPRLITPEVP